MREISVLLLGACTISGFGLPGTLSLPVLISRAFRQRQDIRLHIESENHLDTLGDLLELLEAGSLQKSCDIILLQSMIGRETIPQLGVGARLDRPGWLGGLYRWVRRLDNTPAGHRWINFLRFQLGRRKPSAQPYEQTLHRCLSVFRRVSPGVKIIVLGQGPPMSKLRSVFSGIYEKNRRELHKLAEKYDFDFVDLYPLLLPYGVEEIYQADGLHYTAKGQRIVAEAIIERIRANGVGVIGKKNEEAID